MSCTSCGAVNPEPFKGISTGPKTLEELRGYIQSQGVNLDSYRMFLEQDGKEDDAICLITQDGKFAIYHYFDISSSNTLNKKYDREILYQGEEEAYVVDFFFNELQTRLHNPIYKTVATAMSNNDVNRTERSVLTVIFTIMFIFFSPIIFVFGAIGVEIIKESFGPWDGYYKTESLQYYYYHEDDERWYYYDNGDEQWELSPGLTDKQAKQYFIQTYYDEDITVPDFENSQIYFDNHYDYYDN